MAVQAAGSSAQVLVVEDDDVLRKLLCQTVKRLGFIPHQAVSGIQGLEVLRSESVDVVISDIEMPGMNGLAMMQAAIADGCIQPFIIISSQLKRDTVIQALKLGAFDFIDKPFRASIISQVLDEAFRYARRLRTFMTGLPVSQQSVQSGEQLYLLRIIESAAGPFGNAVPEDLVRLAAEPERLRDFYFETTKKSLENCSKRLQGLSRFESSQWDFGALLRAIHSIRCASSGRLSPETMELLNVLENTYALIRVYRESLNKDMVSSLQHAQDTVSTCMSADWKKDQLPDTGKVLQELSTLELNLQKYIAKAV